jgi:solute:Na+ symporter, SSS family
MLAAIETHFTGWDWAVVLGYLLFTTWIGHALSGKNVTIRDFFLGGRSLPWWAVSGSMVATEISALTFIGVPGGVYALQGDWTYLQWGIGSIIARVIVGYFLVPLYYKEEIYSPYDYMGGKLGEGVRRLVTGLFSLGAILGQSVRVLVTALILQTVTGLSTEVCIGVIGAFAVVWTLMGGMRTVIWTDVIQFCIFLFGGMLALGWLVGHVGLDAIWEINRQAGPDGDINKLRVFDFTLPWGELAVELHVLGGGDRDAVPESGGFRDRPIECAEDVLLWVAEGGAEGGGVEQRVVDHHLAHACGRVGVVCLVSCERIKSG